jgi:hypothetical protein
VVDAATGQIAIDLYSTTAITQAEAGTLVNIAFHLVPGAYVPATSVQLVSSVTPEGHWFSTEAADGQSKFVLSPGVDQLTIHSSAPATPTRVVGEHALAMEDLSKVEEAGSQLGKEANDVPAVLSNGSLAGETLYRVPADVVVAGGW